MKFKYIVYQSVILSFLITTGLFSQDFSHFDLIDGLSSVEVTDIRENENFLWFATTDGLNRFDGEHFKIYRREPNSKNCLGENNIETLFFDSQGLLWIGFKSGGADIYDPRQDLFTRLSEIIDTKMPVRVISIFEDSQKNIWLGTWEEGVYKLTPRKGNKKSYTVEIHYPGYIVSSIMEKPAGFLRFGTYYGFFVYNLNEGKWIDNGFHKISITQFLDSGEENSIWCSTWSSGLLKMSWNSTNPGLITFSEHLQGDSFKSVYRMIGGTDNSIYLGTWGHGLKKLNLKRPALPRDILSGNITASLINSLYKDRHNNIWAGCYGGGILRFNPDKSGLKHFPVDGKLPAPASSLASLADHRILVGTQGQGLYMLDLKTLKLSPKLSTVTSGDFKNYILSLYASPDYVLVGHDGAGIPYMVRKDHQADELKFSEFNKYTEAEKVTAFYPAEDGTIWIGTKQSGLISCKINQENGLPGNYKHYENFGRDEITGFAAYDEHTLLISTHNGLFRFNKVTNQIEKNGKLISNELIYRIVADSKNNCLWIGTSTNLMRMDNNNLDRVETAFPNELLPRGAIRALSLDRQNNLWFSVGGRLFCFMDKFRKIREINPKMLGNNAILSCTSTEIDGVEHLVFGTTDNLIVIEPDLLLSQRDEAKIIFTDLQIDHRRIGAGDSLYGKVVLNVASEYAKQIKLSYKSRWISLSFTETGLDFYNNRYQYHIKGFGDSWQYLDISNPITFSRLDPGQYTLEIRRYDYGPEPEICWSMSLVIIPPWWKSWWFYLVLILGCILFALFGSLFTVSYFRKRHILRLKHIENVKEEELLREKESFFTGLSHDLMTPFSLIMAPANDLLREYNKKDRIREKLEIIRKNASFLSDIFGTILDFKRAELSDHKVSESQLEIVGFTRLVVNAFEYLATSRNIKLTFTADKSSLEVITDNVKVERILYNLLSNAIKFTPDGGKVEVQLISADEPMITLVVRDNGTGMDIKNQARIFEKFFRETESEYHQKNKGLGLGLYIVRKFIDMLGGSVAITSEPGKGTEILIKLPVKAPAFPAGNTIPGNDQISEDKSTILLVEDNPELSAYIRDKLVTHFNVITAENGLKAMALIDSYMPEIIISDIMMPGMDGLTLTKKIKENNKYADIFVALLTARTSTDNELEGYKTGADIYIKKPFDGEVLLNQMINIQSTRQNRKSQILSWLVSQEHSDIEFSSKETFLKKSMQVVEEHIMEPDFKLDEFAAELNISKTVLHRKFRLMVGQTPNQFIRLVRLRKSVHLLQNSDHSISEIAYLTGFSQSHYFIKCFREVYNDTPGSFKAKRSQGRN
jgi:signal transduction histidine kinase/ligand-binding sensor domain-containing protein/DNA-binding response OmpR family regulator